jgi:hypothetical protein
MQIDRALVVMQSITNVIKPIDKTQYEKQLTLAGGRIHCLRCTAQSTRTKLQCGKPAMKSSKKQKCTHHGGLSKGPTTAESGDEL